MFCILEFVLQELVDLILHEWGVGVGGGNRKRNSYKGNGQKKRESFPSI